jgi:hypothetical protein
MDRKAGTTRWGGRFDDATIEAVWQKAMPEPDYSGFRKDRCGASMLGSKYGDRASAYGWEVDHIRPVALGGTDDLINLQPLQWENNAHKGDNYPKLDMQGEQLGGVKGFPELQKFVRLQPSSVDLAIRRL